MIKKITNYFVVPMSICAILVVALNTNTTVDMTNFSTKGLELNYTVSKDVAMLDEKEPTQTNAFDNFFPYLGKNYMGFKEALAFKESRGNYFTVNDFGYLGKYQFGVETLKVIGIYNAEQFLYNPEPVSYTHLTLPTTPYV